MNASIAHLTKPMSRLVLGVDNQTDLAAASAVFDDFATRGGNAFDTAFVYGGGVCEAVFGQWMQHAGSRNKLVVIGKGAHTPHCTPEKLTEQLHISLERLQTDFVDVYMLHRDNLDVPVGEFVDVLNDHARAGQVRVFGGSNWTLERIEAANNYARDHGLQGFGVLSNNFSLARMVDAPWSGCLSVADANSRAWLMQSGMTLLPWSSQARGFFVRGDPGNHEDAELERCWYSPDNFERLTRARALARERGVSAIQIALAYVLHQPFPTLPLIGPRSTAETASSFGALKIALSEQEVQWLNLERDER